MEIFENYGEGLVIQYGSPNSAGYIDKKRFHMHPSYEVLYIPKNVIANTIINGNMIHTDYPIIVINGLNLIITTIFLQEVLSIF